MGNMEQHERQLVREIVGGEPYEYYPLGDYVVRAVGVCGGRPTFKYTRIEIPGTLERLGAGESIDAVFGDRRTTRRRRRLPHGGAGTSGYWTVIDTRYLPVLSPYKPESSLNNRYSRPQLPVTV
jgi:uncharacterized protein (DUF433 family)